MNIKTMFYSVPDPDFEIGGGGRGRSSRPLFKGGRGPVSKNVFFGPTTAPPPDPPVLLTVNLTVISPYSLI